jgi:hypothetical protein
LVADATDEIAVSVVDVRIVVSAVVDVGFGEAEIADVGAGWVAAVRFVRGIRGYANA